ncbi:hypothetical protein ElyMa_002840000 [Elysia marginata]|uniref:Uncharacterized protein n=1 Tax=Elysia marginata TaxID=1093978 RepID=A0AAV4HU52_9GAST|nr:hypothetical protein ElyMa_002840000 [Elysia marginata]
MPVSSWAMGEMVGSHPSQPCCTVIWVISLVQQRGNSLAFLYQNLKTKRLVSTSRVPGVSEAAARWVVAPCLQVQQTEIDLWTAKTHPSTQPLHTAPPHSPSTQHLLVYPSTKSRQRQSAMDLGHNPYIDPGTDQEPSQGSSRSSEV